MSLRIQCVCIDGYDPAHIATFWEAALDRRRPYEDDDQVAKLTATVSRGEVAAFPWTAAVCRRQ